MQTFKEEQRMNQWWLWAILLSSNILMLGIFLPALYKQLILGIAWGENPMSDKTLVLIATFTFLIMGGVTVMVLGAKLEIEIDKQRVRYRYFPFVRSWRTLRFDELNEAYVRKYSPINEYGGRGYRFRGRKNIALNTRGKMGLQLVTNKGKRILLGTQRPSELQALLDKIEQYKQQDYA